MPTGYTAKLYDGEQSFEDFVLGCARAFGALITLRDSPEAPIPESFEPDNYHRDKLREAFARLQEVNAWTSTEAEARRDAAYERSHQQWAESKARTDAQVARYRAMLAEVQAWRPPPALANLQAFMVEQLTGTIDFDGHNSSEPQRQPVVTWWEAQHQSAMSDITYHYDERRKDEERAESRSAWVRALRDSLGQPVR